MPKRILRRTTNRINEIAKEKLAKEFEKSKKGVVITLPEIIKEQRKKGFEPYRKDDKTIAFRKVA